MLELVHIEYWSGKKQKSIVVFVINTTIDGRLIGLKSNKLAGSDIGRIITNKDKLVGMEPKILQSWLNRNLQHYSNALCEFKRGRYSIKESYNI